MKKLLFLFACALPAIAMEKPTSKRLRQENVRSHKITFSKSFFDKSSSKHVIEAREEGSSIPLGHITLNNAPQDKTTGNIYHLEVSPQHQNKGIEYELFERAILELKKQGYAEVTWLVCNTDPYNPVDLAILENRYITMVRTLAGKVACNLEIGPREAGIYDRTPFKLSLQNPIVYSDAQASDDYTSLNFYALHNGKSIGHIQICQDAINQNAGRIGHLFVSSDYRDQGIGYQLFKRAILELRKNRFETVEWVCSQIDTVPIHQLEQKYVAMALKLKQEIDFDFETSKDCTFAASNGTRITPMQILFKYKNENYNKRRKQKNKY